MSFGKSSGGNVEGFEMVAIGGVLVNRTVLAGCAIVGLVVGSVILAE